MGTDRSAFNHGGIPHKVSPNSAAGSEDVRVPDDNRILPARIASINAARNALVLILKPAFSVKTMRLRKHIILSHKARSTEGIEKAGT